MRDPGSYSGAVCGDRNCGCAMPAGEPAPQTKPQSVRPLVIMAGDFRDNPAGVLDAVATGQPVEVQFPGPFDCSDRGRRNGTLAAIVLPPERYEQLLALEQEVQRLGRLALVHTLERA